jgi:hypothetical protein
MRNGGVSWVLSTVTGYQESRPAWYCGGALRFCGDLWMSGQRALATGRAGKFFRGPNADRMKD